MANTLFSPAARWAALSVTAALWAAPAMATNIGTKNGVHDTGCAVNWGASAVMKTDLQNNDPLYPNLMITLDGVTPSDGYSNGGYIEEVNTALNSGPGLLEMNHFYTGPGNLMMIWRLPIGTLYPISGATRTFTPPSIPGATWTFDPVSTNSRMYLWGGGYAQYAFTERPLSATPNADGTFTVNLGDFAAHTGTVLQFNYTWPANATPWTHYYVASAKMTGTYTTPGQPATCQMVNAADDSYNLTNGGTTASVIVNDTANGAPAVIGTNATLVPGTAPVPSSGSLTMNPDGTITVAPGTTPGVYQYPYQICGLPASTPPTCDPAVATVTLYAPSPVPTLGQWALALLSMLLGAAALRWRRAG